MKLVVWIVFGVLAALWTGGAWLAAASMQWAAQAIASGEAADLGMTMARWPVPEWISWWIDPAFVRATQDAVVWAIELMQRALPQVGTIAGWIVAATWLGWGVGLALLLAVAGGASWALGRVTPSNPRPA
jgi:hypothetical protein